MKTYKLTIKHDNGAFNILISAKDEQTAKQLAIAAEGCPISAIMSSDLIYASYKELPEHLVNEYADKNGLNVETYENYKMAAYELFKEITRRKYNYLKVIQQHYGQGWEDVSEYEANSQFIAQDRNLLKHDMKEYISLGYPSRIINRKEVNIYHL